MGSRIGERADDLEQLEDGARPTMGHDQWHGIRVPRADMRKLDVEPVDLCLLYTSDAADE